MAARAIPTRRTWYTGPQGLAIVPRGIARAITPMLALLGCMGGSERAQADDYPFAGNPPVTPRWAYEHWVWEDATNTQASTVGLVGDYKSRNIPVGAVIIDSPWSTAYMNFEFDGARYPDAQTMITGFRNQGIQVVCWMVGMINRSGGEAPLKPHPDFNFARTSGFQLRNPANSDASTNDIFTYWKGTGLAIDFTNQEAVDWFMGSGNANLIAMRVRGFKVDESNAYVSEPVKTSAGSVFGGANITKNQYTAYYHAKVSDWIRQQTAATGTDGLVISRPYSHQGQPAGFHCPISKMTAGWCGDYGGDFAGFAAQVGDIYTSANAGYSALGFEVGGYYITNPTRDSLLRQAQFAALLPVMENGGSNGGLTQHVPWYWDNLNGTTTTVPIYRYYATLHRNLAPFLFHTGVVANLTAKPAVTHTDITSYRHLLGETFLTRAVMAGNNTSVVMNFPAGRWIDWWNPSTVYAGSGQTTVISSIERAPIYVRAGAIVPVNVDNDLTGLGDINSVGKDTILVYPYGGTSLTYHRATGDGIPYENVTISATEGADGSLEIHSPTPRTWLFKVRCFAPPAGVTGADSWSYDSVAKMLTIEKAGSDFTISVPSLTGYTSIPPIVTAQTSGIDTWTGTAATANWSSPVNWSGANTPPLAGDTLVFSGNNRLSTTNDLGALTSYAGLSFSPGAGAFTLSGNSITLAGDISNNSTSNQSISIPVISDAGASRQLIASSTTGQISLTGGLTRNNVTAVGRAFTLAQGSTTATGAATYSFAGTVSITNPSPLANDESTSGVVQRNATIVNLLPGANVSLAGGYWSVGQNNSTGTAVQPATLNVETGAGLSLGAATNFNVGHNFNFANNTNPNSGIVNLNGGTLSAALDTANTTGGKYIRLGVNGSSSSASVASGVINLNKGTFITSRTFVRGGTLANTGTVHTQQSGSIVFNGGTLATDGINNVTEWFQSTAGGTGDQLLPLTAVRLDSDGGTLDTSGCNAATAFGLTGTGGLAKSGSGTLTLSGSCSYTGYTRVNAGILKVSGVINGSESLFIAPESVLELVQGAVSISGNITNQGTLRHFGGTLSLTGTFFNNGVLDLINGPEALPANFVNNGIVLDSSSVRISAITRTGVDVSLSIQSYAGHNYRLQRSNSLNLADWNNVGAAQAGTGGTLNFADVGGGEHSQRFYRIRIEP